MQRAIVISLCRAINNLLTLFLSKAKELRMLINLSADTPNIYYITNSCLIILLFLPNAEQVRTFNEVTENFPLLVVKGRTYATAFKTRKMMGKNTENWLNSSISQLVRLGSSRALCLGGPTAVRSEMTDERIRAIGRATRG
jgi:hypothetical protein